MKTITAIFLFCVALDVNASVTFKAKYSEAADTFQILDCASEWWNGFCGDEGSYRLELEKRLKLSADDSDLFKAYKELRFKYYKDNDQNEKDPLKNRNGLFATLGSLTADPIALAFYSSKSIESAIESLTMLTDSDRGFLKNFYSNFQSKVRPFLIESAVFKKAAGDLNDKLQKKSYQEFFKAVQDFYGIDGSYNYTTIFAWWPPLDRDYAFPVSDFLIMSKNPVKHLKWSDEDIVFHEVVHTLSKRLPLGKKQKLTNIFLKDCPLAANQKKGIILEEPLAVAIGQMLFLKRFDFAKYKAETNWYRNEWVDKFSQEIFPTIESAFAKKEKLDVELIRKLGKICQDKMK